MSDGTVDRRSRMECGLDRGFLAVGLMSLERGPSGRAAGNEAAKQDDQCDRDELDTKTR